MPQITLPRRISTREDIVRFFLFLDQVDRTSFHPDDRFYSRGGVQHSDRQGRPSYTPAEAKLRDRLMRQAWAVAHREGLDIYEIGLTVTGAPDYQLENAPEWLRAAVAALSRRKQDWDPSLGAKGGPAKFAGDYLYHVTTADRLPSIAEQGLVPGLPSRWGGEFASWSSGKVFFTMDLYIAGRFMIDELEREFGRGEKIQLPVLLRVHRKALRGAREDMLWFNVYVERAVPPEKIEVWLPWDHDWAPLLEVYGKFEGQVFGSPQTTEEFDRLRQEFFQSQPEI